MYISQAIETGRIVDHYIDFSESPNLIDCYSQVIHTFIQPSQMSSL